MELPKSFEILREACAQSAISFEIIDSFSGFVVRISSGGKCFLIGAGGIGVYPINRAAPFAIARDKAFTHYVLQKSGFCVPHGGHFFLRPPGQYRRPDGRERTDALRFAERLSDGFRLPLVVKPNSGKGAKFVRFVRSKLQLDASFDQIAENDDIALVQNFVDEPEYRLFVVDGEIAFAYRKMRSVVEGDGRSTVRELCETAILAPYRQQPDPPYSEYLRAELDRRGLTLDSRLAKGELVAIDIVANISAGGQFAGFIEPNSNLRGWAMRLARAVSLRVTGLDVFSHSELSDPGDIIVTDVNGSPNLGTLYELGHRDLVLGVWKDILHKTFDADWPEGF